MSESIEWIYKKLASNEIGEEEAQALIGITRTKNRGVDHTRVVNKNNNSQQTRMLTCDTSNYLSEVVAGALGVSKNDIDIDSSFDKYGMDSIAAIEIVKSLESIYGQLPKTLLFEYPTVSKLSVHLDSIKVSDVEPCSSQDRLIKKDKHSAPLTLIDLTQLFAKVFELTANNVDVDLTFDQYGVDSVGALEFVRELDAYWNNIPRTVLFEYPTLRKLFDFLLSLQSAQPVHDLKDTTLHDVVNIENRLSGVESSRNENSEKYSDIEVRNKDLAIIGLAGRYPGAKDIFEFDDLLKNGSSAISEVPIDRWDWKKYYRENVSSVDQSNSRWGGFINDHERFDAEIFNISPVEASAMDPQERLFLETAWSALEDAGYINKYINEEQSRVGVFVGVMNSDYEWLAAERYYNGDPVMAQSSHWSIANRVSYFFGFNGPSLAVDTACSSSLTALHLASEAIKNGECESAIVGGVNLILHPMHLGKLSWMGMLSKDGKCKSFGKGADGFVDGEGVGAVLIKPLEQAIKDKDYVYGVIKSSSVNSGGKAPGFTVPNPNAQAELIKESLRKANVSPDRISYVEAHGTGTELGDPIEIRGLSKAFENVADKKQFCAVGSVKSNIGHLESAAGIASLTKVLLQLKSKKLYPSLHATDKNEHIDFESTCFYVQSRIDDWKNKVSHQGNYPLLALVSSFGAGGTNANVLIEEYQHDRTVKQRTQVDDTDGHLFVFSGASSDALIKQITHFQKYLNDTVVPITNGKAPVIVKDIIVDEICNLTGLKPELYNFSDTFAEIGMSISDVEVLLSRLADRLAINGVSQLNASSEPIDDLYGKILKENGVEGNVDENYHRDSSEMDLGDIAYTLARSKFHFSHRAAVIAGTKEELIEKIQSIVNKKVSDNVWVENAGADKNSVKLLSRLLSSEVGDSFVRSLTHSNLSDIALAYVLGADLPWQKIFPNVNNQNARIPTYQFNGTRFSVRNEIAKVQQHSDTCYEKPEGYESSIQIPTTRLATLDGLNAYHAEKIINIYDGNKEIDTHKLDHYSFQIDLSKETNIVERVTSIQDQLVDYTGDLVVNILLNHKEIELNSFGKTDYDLWLNDSNLKMLELFNALASRGVLRNTFGINILLPKSNGHHEKCPLHCAYTAFFRSLVNEFDLIKLNIYHVNSLDDTIVKDLLLGKFEVNDERINEWWLDSVENTRSVLTLTNFEIANVSSETVPFKQRGVYVLFGGTGGIGLEVAKHLRTRVNAKVILIGSSSSPSIAANKREILNDQDVSYISANVNKINDVEKALVDIRSTFGAINGVFYTVGRINDALVLDQSEVVYRQAMDPKVLGFANVANALKLDRLDFLVCFSSAASFSGAIGQMNYSHACKAQDLIANSFAITSKYPIQIINWGYWRGVGMADNDEYFENLKARGVYPLSISEGLACLETIIEAKLTQTVVLKSGNKSGNTLSESKTVPTQIQNETNVSMVVQGAIDDVAGIQIDRSKLDLSWDELGINSILAIKVLERIESTLDVKIYPNELFEANTPAGLISRIGHELADDIASRPVTGNIAISRASDSMASNVAFLDSTPRSGSTLLRVMLQGNPEVFSPPELHLLPFRNLQDRRDILTNENKSFIREGLIECYKDLQDIDVEIAQGLMQDKENRALSIRDVYKELASLSKASVLIDKSPSYGQSIDILKNAEVYCDNPRYIFLVRHPLSVIESFVKNRFDKLLGVECVNTWKYAENLWFEYNKNILDHLETIDQKRHIFVRYEDLVSNPGLKLSEICNFLDVDYDEKMLDVYSKDRMTGGLNKESLSIGDPNFHSHKAIDSGLAESWKKYEHKIADLDERTIALANKLGYQLKKKYFELLPAQLGYLSRYGESPKWSLAYRFDLIDISFDIECFRACCETVVENSLSLQSRFIKIDDQWRLYFEKGAKVVFQSVRSGCDTRKICSDLEQQCWRDLSLRDNLVTFVVVKCLDRIKISILAHHLTVDGISLANIAKQLAAYREPKIKTQDSYLEALSHLRNYTPNYEKMAKVTGISRFEEKPKSQVGFGSFSSEDTFFVEMSYDDFIGLAPSNIFNIFSLALYSACCSADQTQACISHRLHRRWINGDYYDDVAWFAGDVPLVLNLSKSKQEQYKEFVQRFSQLKDIAIDFEMLSNDFVIDPINHYSNVRLNYQPVHIIADDRHIEVAQYESPKNERLYEYDLIVRSYSDRVEVHFKYSNTNRDLSEVKRFYRDIKNYISEYAEAVFGSDS